MMKMVPFCGAVNGNNDHASNIVKAKKIRLNLDSKTYLSHKSYDIVILKKALFLFCVRNYTINATKGICP